MRIPSRDLTGVTLVSEDDFRDLTLVSDVTLATVETFQVTWNFFRPTGNFLGHLETFQASWKLSRPFEATVETFKATWKFFRPPGNFFRPLVSDDTYWRLD